MKHGILITAYKNLDHLKEIVRFFEDDSYEIYIHIDKKSKIAKHDILSLYNFPLVKLVSQEYNVNWGGISHLKSILFLAGHAVKNEQLDYLHLISGHDYPIKSRIFFQEFFSKNKGKEYLMNFELPSANWSGGGLNRLELYNLYDIFNSKSNKINRYLMLLSTKIQSAIGIKRKLPSDFPRFYGGSTWWSLTRPCVQHVVDYTEKNTAFFNGFKHSFCSEEIYFQTIIMNSLFKKNVVNEDLRYVDWNTRNGNCPANLDETEYDRLTSSAKIFARKFEPSVSVKLMEKLKKLPELAS